MAKMDDDQWQKHGVGLFLSSSLPSSSSSSVAFEQEDPGPQHLAMSGNIQKRLSKQLSMRETPRDILWERRRRQILRQGQKVKNRANETDRDVITDEDLNELRGCIELGFGFKEGEGQRLCGTLPALDLYFAVNRQLSPSSVSTPQSIESSSLVSQTGSSSSLESPKSDSDSWKIASPGENPQLVKKRLRHWAQAVACSVRQGSMKSEQQGPLQKL